MRAFPAVGFLPTGATACAASAAMAGGELLTGLISEDGWFSEKEVMWPGQRFSLKVKKVLSHTRSDFQVSFAARPGARPPRSQAPCARASADEPGLTTRSPWCECAGHPGV